MQTAYSISVGGLMALVYFANPKNKTNQWCAIAGVFFWIGAVKQALMFEIIPLLQSTFIISGLDKGFTPIHSLCTWVLYTLAMPTIFITACHFCNFNKIYPQFMRLSKLAAYIPGIVLLFFFVPLHFGEYQQNSPPFWIVYAIYNFSFGIASAFIIIRGAIIEKNIMSKKQKQKVALVLLPPLCFWLVSIFVPRLFDIFNPFVLTSSAFEFWQANTYVMLISILVLIFIAFNDGFMGLKLVSQRYNWNENMSLINTSVEYTSHMFKQQASTMEMCINQLLKHYTSSDCDEEILERLNILSRSVSTLSNFVDRIKRHSQIIQLTETRCRITDLLASSGSLAIDSGVFLRIRIPEDLFLVCDKAHMTEVFRNIISNAIEAIHEKGTIEITGVHEKSKYRLMFKDNGEGIDNDKLQDIFMPYYSTKKSKEKNFGLGLYYCKNVITKHGGSIAATSIIGKETTIIITLSSKRVVRSGESGSIVAPKLITSNSFGAEGKYG